MRPRVQDPPQQVQDELQLPTQARLREVILGAAPDLINDFERMVRDCRNYRHMRSLAMWNRDGLRINPGYLHAEQIDWLLEGWTTSWSDDPPWAMGPHRYTRETYHVRNRLTPAERADRGFLPYHTEVWPLINGKYYRPPSIGPA